MPEEEIDKRYCERPCYIAPNAKSGEEAFAVIRDAIKDKGRVVLARIVFANREHIMAIEPWNKGLLGTTLRYNYEMRDEREAFKGTASPTPGICRSSPRRIISASGLEALLKLSATGDRQARLAGRGQPVQGQSLREGRSQLRVLQASS